MADLLTLVRQDTKVSRVASTHGGEYAGPCPFCGGEDRFRCWPDHPEGGGQWWCRQCGRGGDLIAYRVERGDLTPQEAGRLRHGTGGDPQQPPREREPRETPTRAPVRHAADAPDAAWREKARAFADYCASALWEDGHEGLEHLRGRGLTDATINTWGLGWHERSRRRDWAGTRVYLPRGVVIPWTVGGDVWHVKVRLFETWKGREAPKYIRAKGGTPTLFGLDHVEGKRVVVICEGELDAALLWQEAGDLVDVVAIGTKGAKAEPRGLAHLVGASRWLLALDADAEPEAEVWSEYSARVHRIRPLTGNDITDFHQAGGDLRAWVEHHLERLGWPGLEAEAEAILEAGDLADIGTRRRYAQIAQRLGWRCSGGTWSEWAELVNNDRLAAVEARLQEQAAEIDIAERRVTQLELAHGVGE